ncbi:Dutp pyrophosphatase [Pandoravirus kuranda]|uniref:dUTP diphosphatase n=2 Tax=Pandoravirus TaxID=2060084 RepID=A0AA95J4N0_9VIRU|nr:Deoxyuridine 5'-triphosphate nucleotidohydrolase [Pandoravirus neocaledonia]AVK76433.1 Deoxyuridine 5'-triphosphate nucleotidohydrolase [Pandoravirus neocaledonia]WBR14893.1 Dutp pyrophosphatase [Pandoravirus kuranda]
MDMNSTFIDAEIALMVEQHVDEFIANVLAGGSGDAKGNDGSATNGDLASSPTKPDTGAAEPVSKETPGPAAAPTIATVVAEGEKRRKRAFASAEDPAMVLKCKRLHADAVLPERATADSAGYDLHAVEATSVPAHGQITIPIGLAVAVPRGHYGRVAPRSSLAAKGIDVGAGVVDADYRGPVKVILFNHGPAPYDVIAGDSIAQLIIERIATPEARWADDLDETDRGNGGFGSTGR